jgi:hypothetical protein
VLRRATLPRPSRSCAGTIARPAGGEGAFTYARGDAVLAAMPIRARRRGRADRRPKDLRGRWRDVLGEREVGLGTEAHVGGLAGALPVVLLERA